MALGPGLDNVVVAIALVSWAELARVVRAKTQAVKEMSYVEAARALGCTDTRIMSRHIIPNILPPVIVLISLILPTAVLSTTALSFLGLGSQPPAPDWGVILNEGIIHLEMAPWISIFSGSAIVWTVLGFSLIGVALRDTVDPQLRAEASQRPA
jgi:peptide/nickel transport system permease protein